ncbi:MAG: hypothetical protein Phog2KO_46520 [Phototrophicaceae bacterium]
MTRKLLITMLFSLLIASMSSAQSSSGQLCIRAFEDRNANGSQDANEPPIIRGISATLSNATGIIVDTALMESSSTASSGTLCFQGLEAGQYTIRVSSADYNASTPSDFTAAVSDSGIPQVLSYGGQFIPVEAPVVEQGVSQEERLQGTLVRSIFAGLGALVIMGAMTVVGALIYFFVLRNRQAPPPTGVYQPVPQTGAYPAVPTTSTGQHPVVNTPSRAMPAVSVDATPTPTPAPTNSYDMYSDDGEEDTNHPSQRFNTDPYNDAPDDDFRFNDDEDSIYKPPSD